MEETRKFILKIVESSGMKYDEGAIDMMDKAVECYIETLTVNLIRWGNCLTDKKDIEGHHVDSYFSTTFHNFGKKLLKATTTAFYEKYGDVNDSEEK